MSGGEPNFPAPVRDRDSAPFWDAADAGRIRLQVCTGCERGVFPPTPGRCPYCGLALEWRDHDREVSVYSWIGVEHAIHDWEAGLIPYSIVLARLDGRPDVRLPCLYAGSAADLSLHQPGKVSPVSKYGNGCRFVFQPASGG
jgi:uncharacterized OB-fold protein